MTVAQVESHVAKLMRRNLGAAALVLQSTTADRLSEKEYPPASTPGEYPARRTGDLAESTTVDYELGGLAATIGPTMPYSRWLVGSGRKMTVDVLNENRTAIIELLTRG